MSSERGGLLKTRAENFARRLQTRLRSLSDAEESSWASEVSSSSDNDIYYDIDSSLASPEEEVSEPIFIAEQNRDSLQRSDSSGSQYFDTVENVEDHANIPLPNSPVTNHKKIPILHLETESPAPMTNGYINLLDTDLGCSRVHEMPSLELDSEVSSRETSENSCDSNALVDNNSTWRETEEEDVSGPDLQVCNYEVAIVEIDTRPADDILSTDVSEDAVESTSISFCVFCDIEQIKSSMSTKCTEPDCHVDITSIQNEAVQLEDKLERPSKIEGLLNSDESNDNEFPPEEENVSEPDCLVYITSVQHEVVQLESKLERPSKFEGLLNSDESNDNEFPPEEENVSEPDCLVDITSIQHEVVQLECNLERPSKFEGLVNSDGSNLSECPADEENVSLTDLLEVLKQEIPTESEQRDDNVEVPAKENLDYSKAVYPSIEVRESTPESSNTNVQKDEDEDDDFDSKIKTFRRSSSLKTGKTPPGTPGRKKIVRFADVLGLDLADVKTFLDEVPTIPKSAYEDLHGIDLSLPGLDSPVLGITVVTPQIDKTLVPLFSQPSVQPNFLDRVRENNVCLESAYVSDMSLFAISGLIRVKNIDFHKSVYVRYTINNWSSFSDLQAKYVQKSCDGFSDKFTFVLYAHTLTVGERIEFALRYHTAGAQFWDSNGGRNYIFECTRGPTKTADPGIPPSPIETWASFY